MLINAHRNEVSASLRHLKLFESVARLRSVRKASEECHLSQPAVTQAIAKLEEQTGVTLLDRRASGTYANEFGTIFQRRTQRLFDQIERALVELGVPTSHAPIPLVASRITRSQIRSLTAIVENGSFAQAARALAVSQTSLQRAARDLERTLRMPLFIQTAGGIMATPAGAEFSRAIKVAMRELEAALDELEAARGNFGGKIVIGAMLLTGSVVLASVLQEFMAAYPNANVHVWSGTAEDTMKYLRAGDLDVVIGLLREPPLEGLVGVALAESPFVVVGRKNHPLAKKGTVTLNDLAKYEWIVGTPGATRRARFDGLFPEQRRPKARLGDLFASHHPPVAGAKRRPDAFDLLRTAPRRGCADRNRFRADRTGAFDRPGCPRELAADAAADELSRAGQAADRGIAHAAQRTEAGKLNGLSRFWRRPRISAA